MMGGNESAILTQTNFRFRKDTVLEAAVHEGWNGAINENWIASLDDIRTSWRIRYGVTAENIPSPDTADGTQDNLTCFFSRNGESFTPITTVSNPIIVARSLRFPDYKKGDPTTQQISTGDYYPEVDNNQVTENATPAGNLTWDFSVDPQDVECEWTFKVKKGVSLERGDIFEFRLRRLTGAVFNGGYNETPLMVYHGPRVLVKGRELRVQGKELAVK